MAQTTKRAFAESLKKLLSQKPLDKIKIADITNDCEVNRQTFYYHFKDIYDLLEWIYTNEATRALGDKKTYDTWQDGFYEIFEYILENKIFVINTYNSVSREYLERYLYNEAYYLLLGVVEEKSKDISVRDKDKAFIADFYKFAFVGLVIEWIRKGMREDPKDIIKRLNILIYGNIELALERYRTDKHNIKIEMRL
ncbi:TetR/AcrR family transcriptional regulator [uncultured Clostridium sp.]|uniref:TetR/AcrR family transcriptional regulator n=1 Tax=uncultured Clostridium sp. TaxID=59620 RepID=UPI00263906C3|nr:TetR/AcrR family transcriptional regulator [uncultured Clostridium sp.]